MGVPAFFKWLIEKYPKTVEDVLERRQGVVDGIAIPLDLNEANPNGVEYDNLYVDMNGLIHPCSHPEDREAPTSEYDMYLNVTKYVDRLFAAVRPRRMLFLAIDGVAPRAKMNQQRSRRFRSAQDAKERAEALQEVMEEMRIMGIPSPESKGPEWDSNVITPGTEFMSGLSMYLRFYILDRMNKDAAWRNIEVILSDASVPGEGEHKVMAFIRHQRTQPGYAPNQRHVLHGLDADLIMLALATHEAHFTILREEVTFGGGRGKNQGKSDAQRMLEEMNNREGAAISSLFPEDEWVYAKPLQRLNIAVLRGYLSGEFGPLSPEGLLPFGYDLERIIDDFVFLCFFVGNDFLPHLPSLDIRDGAIDFLIETYKDLLPSMGGYVTSPGGVVNLRQVDIILGRVGQVEDMVFQRKKAREDTEAAKRNRNNVRRKGGGYDKHSGDTLLKNIQNNTVSSNSTFGSRDIDKIALVPLGVPAPPPHPPSQAAGGEAYGTQSNASAAQLLRAKFNTSKVSAPDGSSTSASTMDVDVTTTTGDLPAPMLLGKRINSDMSISERDNGEAEADLGDTPPTKILRQETASSSMNDDDDVGDDIIIDAVEDEEEEKRKGLMGHYRQFMRDGAATKEAKDIIKVRLKTKQNELIDKQKLTVTDDIKLHESGWKDRYYGDAFKKEDLAQGGGLSKMCYHYIKGLLWVFKYYYEGCVSWNWFYPFHYAPFASDLINVDSLEIEFELSQPFHPFEQLLSVLPSESAHCLPEACSWLMTDRESPIIDIYNSDIPIDPNGKPLPWLWVLLINFIDESRVMSAMSKCAANLTPEETSRNSWGPMLMFLHRNNSVAMHTLSAMEYAPMAGAPINLTGDDKIDAALIGDMEVSAGDGDVTTAEGIAASKADSEVYFSCEVGNGICGLLVKPPPHWYSPLDSVVSAPTRPMGVYVDIPMNNVITMVYRGPKVSPHESRLLAGVQLDESILSAQDFIPKRQRVGRGQVNILEVSQSTRTHEARFGTDQRALGGGSRVEYDQFGHARSASASVGLVTNQPFFQQGNQHGNQQHSGGRGGYDNYSGGSYDRPRNDYGGSNRGRDGYSGGGYAPPNRGGGGYDSWDNSRSGGGGYGGGALPPPSGGGYSGYQYSGYQDTHRGRAGAPQRPQYPGGNNQSMMGAGGSYSDMGGGYGGGNRDGGRGDSRGGSQFSHNTSINSAPPRAGEAPTPGGYSGYTGPSYQGTGRQSSEQSYRAPPSKVEYSGSRNQQMYGSGSRSAPPPSDRGQGGLSTFSARNPADIPTTLGDSASQLRGPDPRMSAAPAPPAPQPRQSRDPRLRK